MRALVVDDAAENRDVLRRMLEKLGVQVEVAEDGPQALERMDASRPEIVFLDIRMLGLDGMETLRRLRQDTAWQNEKVVAISASVLEHERRALVNAGLDDFPDKPFRFGAVSAKLAGLLEVAFEYEEGEESRAANE